MILASWGAIISNGAKWERGDLRISSNFENYRYSWVVAYKKKKGLRCFKWQLVLLNVDIALKEVFEKQILENPGLKRSCCNGPFVFQWEKLLFSTKRPLKLHKIKLYSSNYGKTNSVLYN